MSEIVDKLLKMYIGGIEFFDNLDAKIRENDVLINKMIKLINEETKYDYIVVSGKFGYSFYDYCLKNNLPVDNIICLNGSLRFVEIDNNLNINLSNKNVIFLDDSFYSGKTRNKVKNYIEQNNGKLINTYVFYDGSLIKDKDIVSFYRYYDNI